MWKLSFLALVQSMLLSGGQVMLKIALQKMGNFALTREFWVGLFTNWWFMGTGVFMGLGSVLWMYILKKFPFSIAYPMVSLSYVFGMLAAIFFFHESVSLTRWIGVLMIIGGCFLIVR